MRCLRVHPLVRSIVFMLLAWTAMDLTFTRVCSLDRADTLPVGGSVQLYVDADSSSSPGSHVPQVEDCFCCSHCVSIQQVQPVAAMSAVSSMLYEPVAFLALSQSRPAYHPPQARA